MTEINIEPGYYPEFDSGRITPSPFQNRTFPQGWEALPETIEFIGNIRAVGIVQPLAARPQ